MKLISILTRNLVDITQFMYENFKGSEASAEKSELLLGSLRRLQASAIPGVS